jgi:SSS family solute:Na+ symporter
MFNLWKPVVPSGVEGTWAPVKEAGRQAWYFNVRYPWPVCCYVPDHWFVVLVYDQYIVQRILGAVMRSKQDAGTIFAGFLKLTRYFFSLFLE